MVEAMFTKVKSALIGLTILTMYDVTADLKISADASSYSLGAVLLQRKSSSAPWKPVICIPFSHWDGEKLRSNWKGGFGFYLGLRAIQWLHFWQIGNRGNRPQTSGFTPRDKKSQWPTSTYPKVSHSTLSSWLHYYSCTGEKLAYSRCTVTDNINQYL